MSKKPASGAAMDHDMPPKQRKPKPRSSGKIKPADGPRQPVATKPAAGSTRGLTPNPYCNCTPCKCAPPCTCGLELTAQEVRTEWSEEDAALVYSVVDIWTPKPGAKRAD